MVHFIDLNLIVLIGIRNPKVEISELSSLLFNLLENVIKTFNVRCDRDNIQIQKVSNRRLC